MKFVSSDRSIFRNEPYHNRLKPGGRIHVADAVSDLVAMELVDLLNKASPNGGNIDRRTLTR